MKFILLLIIILFALPVMADERFPNLEGRIEQEVGVATEEGVAFDVLLVSDSDNNYRLIIYSMSNSGNQKQFDLPNFWKGGAAFTGRAAYPASIALAQAENGFAVKVRDPSSDAQKLDLLFRWERGRFRLVGEKKGASPLIDVNLVNSEKMSGRWNCSRDTNLLTNEVITKSPRGMKDFREVQAPRYLDDYVIQPADLNEICK